MKQTLILSFILFALAIILSMNMQAQNNGGVSSIVNIEEFEGLGINSVEEALNGRFGLDVPVPAENTVKAGDTIRGVVRDSYGPMMHVNVVEIDKNKKVQAYSVSDYNGKFSFRAVDPKRNKIQVSFVGYLTVSSPIDTTYFDIKMMDIHNDQVFEISLE